MISRFLTLLLFIFPSLVFGQSYFKKGYVVNLAGDTAFGYIQYKDFAGNPPSVFFKSSLSAEDRQVCGLSNTKSFNIEGYKAYERHIVSISLNEIRLDRLNEISEEAKIDTVFLELLLRGNKLNLYSYKDRLKTRYYVLDKENSIPFELTYKEGINGPILIYKQELTKLAVRYSQNTGEIINVIETSDYTQPGLIRVIRKINDVNEATFSKTIENRQKLRVFIGSGINYSRLTYTGQNIVTYDRSEPTGPNIYKDHITTSSYSPIFSVGFDMFSNRETQRLILRNQLTASSLTSATTSVFTVYYPTDRVENRYKLSALVFSYSPQVLYNFYNREHFSAYAGAGVSLDFWHYTSNKESEIPLNPGSNFVEKENDNYMFLKKRSYGATCRAGMMLNKKLDIQFITHLKKRVSGKEPKPVAMNVSMVDFGINYLFSRKVKEHR